MPVGFKVILFGLGHFLPWKKILFVRLYLFKKYLFLYYWLEYRVSKKLFIGIYLYVTRMRDLTIFVEKFACVYAMPAILMGQLVFSDLPGQLYFLIRSIITK